MLVWKVEDGGSEKGMSIKKFLYFFLYFWLI